MRNTGLLFVGGLLILAGLLSFVGNFFEVNGWGIFWPSLIILLGLWMLLRPAWSKDGMSVIFVGDVARAGKWTASNEDIWAFVADINLDFREAAFAPGETIYRLTGFVADVDVLIQQGVGVSVASLGFLSSLKVLGHKQDRFVLPYEWKSPDYDHAERKLRIETTFFVNDLNLNSA
jgi:hypothetical protein